MFLNGTIKLKGPEFEKKEIIFESDVSCEFFLETDKAAIPVIDDFDVHIQVDDDKEIKIIAQDLMPDDMLFNYLNIKLKGTGGEISLSLSPEQAAALSQILNHYVTAYYEAKALRTEKVVKSA